jgi:DNA-binding NtrC family response regulator
MNNVFPSLTGAATQTRPVEGSAAPAPTGATLDAALSTMTLTELEDKAITAALVRFNNNRTRAARALGISVRTLQRKLGAKNGEGEGELATEGGAPEEPLVGSTTE